MKWNEMKLNYLVVWSYNYPPIQEPSHFSWRFGWKFWKMSSPVNTALRTYVFLFGYSAIWLFFRSNICIRVKYKLPLFLPTLTWLNSLKQILSFSYWKELNILSQNVPSTTSWKKKDSFCLSGKVWIVEHMWDASRIWKYPVQPLTCLEIHME